MGRYSKIPTENLKFSQFMGIMLNSGMDKATIQEETCRYVQVLETNYNDKISVMKMANDKLKKEVKNQKAKGLDEILEKKDLEQLFARSSRASASASQGRGRSGTPRRGPSGASKNVQQKSTVIFSALPRVG